MALVPPAFWFQDDRTTPAYLLSPLEAIWQTVHRRRWRETTPTDCGLPVICIGNVTLGGAGKTPVALDLAKAMNKAGKPFQFLTKGYGGSEEGPRVVDPTLHGPSEVGDEPLLLAQEAQTWVAKDRVAGALTAKAAGAKCLVLDDGFQDPSLVKTTSILVLDAFIGVGNGRVCPAGPLREPFKNALKRTDIVVVLGPYEGRKAYIQTSLKIALHRLPKPVLRAQMVGHLPPNLKRGARCLAFAGIGRPEKFFQTAETCGLILEERRSFPDHHPFTRAEILGMVDRANQLGLSMVTTEKDHVRLPDDLKPHVHRLELSLRWRDGVSPYDLIFKQDHNVA